jgi:hypothetical protein
LLEEIADKTKLMDDHLLKKESGSTELEESMSSQMKT